LLALRSLSGAEFEFVDWHSHPFLEFTLVTNDQAKIAYPPGWKRVPANTLLCYHPEEKHGAKIEEGQTPSFWVIHFALETSELQQFPSLSEKDPKKRLWKLSNDQISTFRWLFTQIMSERNANDLHNELAVSAWLRILLITVDRWSRTKWVPETYSSLKATPEVRRLWQIIHENVSTPGADNESIFDLPNYDSVRHAFKKTFGCSPRELMIRLRMEKARSLLLETNLSVKEVSDRVGYDRQHEFYRAFHRYNGVSPTQWRENPLSNQQP